MQGYTYTVNHNGIVVATAITIIQIKAVTCSLEILRVSCSQHLSTTSAQVAIQLNRKSAAATVTSATPLKMNTDDPTALAAGSTSGTGITAAAEGTDTDVLIRDSFNVLNGWLYLPVPEERIVLKATEILGLKFIAAPASHTFTAQIVFRELR